MKKMKKIITKINKINWNKLIKLLKIVYILFTFDFNNINNEIINNLNIEEKIMIGILILICAGASFWTIMHDKNFEKKLKELDDYNDKWRRQR